MAKIIRFYGTSSNIWPVKSHFHPFLMGNTPVFTKTATLSFGITPAVS
jgi:hypothetical protein